MVVYCGGNTVFPLCRKLNVVTFLISIFSDFLNNANLIKSLMNQMTVIISTYSLQNKLNNDSIFFLFVKSLLYKRATLFNRIRYIIIVNNRLYMLEQSRTILVDDIIDSKVVLILK